MRNKFFVFLSFFALLITIFPFPTNAEESEDSEKIVIHYFDDRLCSVCKNTKDFLTEKVKEYDDVELIIYAISDTEKLSEIAELHGVDDYRIMAPTIFIGDNFFQLRDFTTREEEDLVKAIEGEVVDRDCCLINIPFFNIEVDIGGWSLPVIAVILGSVDGFNVCSIGALILILSIVLVFNSKKKIFFFGGLFIATTVIIYGMLVFVWGKLFETLIGHLEILRIIVGLASLGGGFFFLKEFWRFYKHGPTCEASSSPIARKATEKLQKVFKDTKQETVILAGAVVSFAIAITIVELPCSIGVPIAFSVILVEEGVSLLEHILYISIFLFFYMLIEIIIFVGAVFTKKIWIANSRAITWVTFIGALILFYLAFYYLFS